MASAYFQQMLAIIAAGAGGVAPAALPSGYVAKWSADSITGVANGAAVNTWTDEVNSVTADKPASKNAPTYVESSTGGKPAVRFNGTDQVLTSLRAAATAAIAAIDSSHWTVVVVGKTNGSTTAGAPFAAAQFAGAAYMTMQADGSVVGLNTKASTQAPHTSQTSWGTWGVASQPALTTRAHTMLAINGGYLGGNNNITGNTSGTGNIGLGAVARSDGAFSNYWNGDLQDVLIWPRMLTAAEMIQVQMWACDKYTQAYPWSAYSNLMVFSGDSLTAGAVASNVVTASSYPYKLMQDAGRPYGAWTNVGVRSFTIDELTARDSTWTDPIPSLIGKPTTLCAWEWYNQKSDGHPGVYNKALTYIAARKAVANQRIVWGTSTCYNVADASRVSYNSAMDAAGLVANNLAQGYVPIHNNSFIGVEGAYAANPTYYSDTIHMSDIGYTAMKALFDAELVARGLYA